MLKKTLSLCFVISLFTLLPALGQGEEEPKPQKVPKQKNGMFNVEGAVRGSGFRVTIIHPMRGNFAEYDKIEIVNVINEVGDRLPAEEIEKYTDRLFSQFQKSGVFREVRKVDRLELAGNPENKPDTPASSPEAKRTLVLTNRAIYYKPGSRNLRAIGLGFGYHRFVVRFQIYDKERGMELAMGNISGEVNEGFGSMPLLAGNSDARNSIVEGLINRIEVRRALSEQ